LKHAIKWKSGEPITVILIFEIIENQSLDLSMRSSGEEVKELEVAFIGSREKNLMV